MDEYEHAQQILSAMVSGWAASGRPLPGRQEASAWAETAMMYASAFREKNANEPKERI